MIFPNPFRFVAAMARTLLARIGGYEILASPDVQDARMAICDPCDKNIDGQCRICTCYLLAKTALNTEVCPLQKWKSVWRKRQKSHTI